jgi:hypothetical protein
VAWGGGLFVAVGDWIMTSPDGATWTIRWQQGELYDVAWSGTRFVVVGFLRRGWFADYSVPLIATSP